MKKVLITGSTGFVGTHLTEYLAERHEFELFGTSLTAQDSTENKIQIEKIDLKNASDVADLVNKIKPDQIYHLAAFTSPGDSFDNPTPVVLGNIEIQMNLLNAVKSAGLINSRVLVVTSGEVYGLVSAGDLPLVEESPLRPVNPYAVSKVAQDFLGLQYALSYKMDIVRVRPFNHTGPAQSPSFVVPSFAKRIAEIEKGQCEPTLSVGNLAAKRDFTDVRDIIKGYALLMEKGISGEVYNIGSGMSYAISDLLKRLLALSKKEIIIVEEESKMRPIDVADVYCDFTKLNSLTGWKPEIGIDKTLQDTLDYWRSVV